MEQAYTHKRMYIVKSPEGMMRVGRRLAYELCGGDVVLLSGELGAGKTVFCQGIATGLKIKSRVVSPTFTIMNEYIGKRALFCHFDAYRLSGADEATEAGLAEFIGSEKCICAVEWWQNIEELFDGCNTVRVSIEKIDDKKRRLEILR